jgi:hypothetical protein
VNFSPLSDLISIIVALPILTSSISASTCRLTRLCITPQFRSSDLASARMASTMSTFRAHPLSIPGAMSLHHSISRRSLILISRHGITPIHIDYVRITRLCMAILAKPAFA